MEEERGEPPPYQRFTLGTPSGGLQPPQPETYPTLILDGCSVYSSRQMDWTLFQLSDNPVYALATKYHVASFAYSSHIIDGVMRIQVHAYRIYKFKDDDGKPGEDDVEITSMPNSKYNGPFEKRNMCQVGAPECVLLQDHFRSSPCAFDPTLIRWTDMSGRLVAIETKARKLRQGPHKELPRLEIKIDIDELTLDLLVTCWCARLWRQNSRLEGDA